MGRHLLAKVERRFPISRWVARAALDVAGKAGAEMRKRMGDLSETQATAACQEEAAEVQGTEGRPSEDWLTR